MGIVTVPSGMVHLNKDTANALAGTSGEPSEINKFVTDADIRNSDARVAYAIHGATEIVNISNANPSAGQVLRATGPSTAAWFTLPGIYDLSNSTPSQISINTTGNAGSAITSSRSDHIHPVASGAPSTIGLINSEGISLNLSRQDHVHAHGQLSDSTLHALATQDAHGFLAKEDKLKIDTWHTTGSGSIIGAEYSYRDTALTASTSYVTYHSHTTKVVEPGEYRYAWSYEVSTSQQSSYATVQVYVDGVLVAEIGTAIPQAVGRSVVSGFRYIPSALTTAHTFYISIKKTGSATVQCHRCDLEFWRKY